MYSGRSRWLIMFLLSAVLVGCGAAPTAIEPGATSSLPFSETSRSTNTMEDTLNRTLVDTPTADGKMITAVQAIPPGWRRVAWQGLSVPLPPAANGIVSSAITTSNQTYNVPVLAAGVVDFPPPPTPTGGAIGEYPGPPRLVLLKFAGTLDEWIALEEKSVDSAEGGVLEPVELLSIAGREARHYQRTVPGFNYNDYYVVKLTDTTLLWIYTDKEMYGPMVDGLTITAP